MSNDAPLPIGGYFELELPRPKQWLHDHSVLLNSGRACLEYLLRAVNPSRIYLPKFTCDALLEPVQRTGINYLFYEITQELEINGFGSLSGNELLLYTNYFGLKNKYCHELAERYGSQLVLDYSQGYFETAPLNASVFYSPRKFFGVPDGGCLYTKFRLPDSLERDVSMDRYSHLIGRYDLGAESSYDSFKANDESLSAAGLKKMSVSTERLLASIEYDRVRDLRQDNFATLHRNLEQANLLKIDGDSASGPMVYPFLCEQPRLRESLIKNKIFVATYWPNVFEWCEEGDIEWRLAKNLIPLPVDQRYTIADMNRIIEVILDG